MWWLRFLAAATLAAVFGGAFVRLLVRSPTLVVLAAVLPAACWVAAVSLLGRRVGHRWPLLLLTAVAGAAFAAFAASYMNTLALALTTRAIGEHAARWLTPSVLAPFIEEAAKASVLVALLFVRPYELKNIFDGVVHGALVGIGFAFTENLEYFTLAAVQGGPTGLLQSVYVRAVLGGFSHAAFAGATGAGFGLARQDGRRSWRAAGIAGFVLAAVSHLFWNILVGPGITETLCNAPRPGAACQPNPAPLDLWVRAPGIALLGLAPALLILLAFFAIARRRPAQSAMSDEQ